MSFPSPIQPGEPKLVTEERLGRRIVDREISIFDAEKYFNEGQDQKENQKTSAVTINLERVSESCDVSGISRLSSVSSVNGRNYRTGSSEASWNSQSGLLSNSPNPIAVSLRNLPLVGKRRGSSTKWFFGFKCPCSCKKSVQVEEKTPNPKTPVHLNCNSNGSSNPKNQNSKSGVSAIELDKNLGNDGRTEVKPVTARWANKQDIARDSGRFSPENHFSLEPSRRVVSSGRSFSDGGGFSFPILNPPATGKLLLNGVKPVIQLETPPRESLELFRPSDELAVRKSTELQRRLLMSFPGDSDRRSFTFPASPKTRATVDDDAASDASSDLFEIESFSNQTTSHPMYRWRDSIDEIPSTESQQTIKNGGEILQFRRSLDRTMTPSTAPTECYEPSEVSIDWSVTTAEGFDRVSVTNFSPAASDCEDLTFTVKQESEKVASGGSRRKGNGLLSCRCEEAVNVGPHPVKFVSDQRHVGPPAVPVDASRVSGGSRLVNLSSTPTTRANSGKPLLARSHSARMPRALATTQ